MLNRKIQPEVNTIEDINFLHPQHFIIEKDVKLHWIKEVDDDAVKVDFVFDAGSKKSMPALANFCNSLLLSGTKKYTADNISAQLDGLGGFYQADVSREGSVVSLYGLRKNIFALIQVLINAINEVTFPQAEIDQFAIQKKQGFKVSSEKVSFLARRLFTEKVFQNTNYGRVTEYSDYDAITRDGIIDFHKQNYLSGLTKVCVVGNLDQKIIEDIIEQVRPWSTSEKSECLSEAENAAGEFRVEKEGAVQTAIRIGRIMFNRRHEDYLEFSVTNLILGGYFGSRLMSNIREDKGYTYGIGSGLAEMKELGYFFISTEVGKDVADDALNEIKKEISQLQEEEVSEEELNLVRNYIIGQMLKSSDGPFAMMDRYLGVADFDLDYDFYKKKIALIKSIQPKDVKRMAKKYLDPNKMTIVLAG